MNPSQPPHGGYSAQGDMSVQGNGAHWFPQDIDYSYEEQDMDGDHGGGDNDNDNEGGDNRDPKRRRIARACDMCRKKKIKCDGKMPKCSHCENYKTECIFTHVEKKRAPPKGAKYIEGLENRLGRMESLLRMSGLLGEDDGGRTDLGTLEKKLQEKQQHRSNAASPVTNSSTSNRQSGDAGTPSEAQPQRVASPNVAQANGATKSPLESKSPNVFKRDAKEVDALADQMCSLITNNCGETRYIGSSSGFSIFSPKGIQWVNEKTGDNSFQHMIATATVEDKAGWDHWKPEVFNDLFQRRIFKPLPGRQECYALLKDYFENFNCMFPLFHEPTFMHLVDKHYSLEPYDGSGWWASLNVALAIGHRLRVMSNVVGQEEDEVAWAYLKNAMAVMSELTMRNTDLLSVQALLGMALFLQGTPNPQPSFFLVAAAIRLAHSIGLHKRGSGFNLNEVENEQRKRVFWIAYLMDKDICLRSGRPPSQDDDDMNVDLPSEDPIDNVGNVPLSVEQDGKKTMNLFRLMCSFAQIQSRVYKQLYSVKASRQSDGELLNTIGDLDAQLEEWKDSIPIDFRPEHEIKAAHTPLILHVVVLHFAYYNCLTTIHRMSVHHGYWTSRLSDYAIQGLNARPLNPRVFMSAALCVNAARTSIGLIRYIPQGDYACVWLVLYYPVSALVTLFANILQNPQDARARSDLKLMSSVVSFLTMLERDVSEANGNVRRMLSVCAEFERIARVALDKTEREMRGRGKRKQAEREREKALKERISGEVAQDLEEGKSLEQIQVETQAAYRRPVQTPSLRASITGSQSGSQPSNSPAGFHSPPGGSGPEYHAGQQGRSSSMSRPQHNQHLQPNGQHPQQQQYMPSQQPGPFNIAPFSQMDANMQNFAHNGRSGASPQPPHMAPFTGPPMNPDGTFQSPHMEFPSMPFTAPPGTAELPGGAFQQPFVPQDLWQMPMTLEWDWAEGLGLGAFTPGPGFDGQNAGFPDMNMGPPPPQ
ncbi:ABC-transporter-regulating transcription factor [Fulvia fulva]|uniref:ABC-transporter-regulating transcription factor n=1 Tax=Passalora fulva TaxID=5499 RepID=A0A9Q8L8D7_PASFU|nr:ABC-transporter-regulating transcription factor [Fulvia fulva]KAK4634957.1 ABC-transporter-regulating transcription factor [Fulvia fulva]KAK4636415.1 ABC-transporter-regulating transcription factor [Fulvia fulva]UJO12609.1 ABC-transporter-regulating transcription factor [Fulvia fulva]WPV08874.1 ABC-transporter-regulating transcription factor [Fulvia fulva]WPV23644.1 ABC-transporter-regulating transcription factor [Fulvia fulva]